MTTEQTRLTQKRYDRQAALFDLNELPMELMGFKRFRKMLWGAVDGGRVLEIGVGTGKNLFCHPQGARVVAVDISPKMLSRAAERRDGRAGTLTSYWRTRGASSWESPAQSIAGVRSTWTLDQTGNYRRGPQLIGQAFRAGY